MKALFTPSALMRNVIAILLFLLSAASAADSPTFEQAGAHPLDPTTFSQWLAGQESLIPDTDAKDGPAAVVWSAKSKPDWRGVKFGPGREVGPRHLRIGFT